jgi:hypothetical protein
VDSRGTQITAHRDIWQACDHAKEIARQRGIEVEVSVSFTIKV